MPYGHTSPQVTGPGNILAPDRGDQPVQPQPCRQETDQPGEDGAFGPVQPGPGIGAAQYGDLVPEYQQFCVLGGG